MDKKYRKAYITVSMLVVAVSSIIMLKNMFPDVSNYNKTIIVISSTLFSGVVARFLFPQNHQEEPDAKPKQKNKHL